MLERTVRLRHHHSVSSRTALFAVTVFVSSALLFVVQPMIAKMVLPLLGGAPAVWNTCMVFFQACLLIGYAYAHFSTRWLGVKPQAAVHCSSVRKRACAFAQSPTTASSVVVDRSRQTCMRTR